MYLKWMNLLVFYIRPDYDLFTTAMGFVLLLSGVWTLLFSHDNRSNHHANEVKMFTTAAAFIFVIAGILTPRQSLSSNTAFRRGPNQNMQIGALDSNPSTLVSPLLQKVESTNYTIADWIKLLQIDPEPSNYEGRAVTVDGFIQPKENGYFLVARFVLSCCIVDASPIGIYVNQKLDDLQADEWVRVSGKFIVQEVDGKRVLAIDPDSIIKIPEPLNPYFY